MRIARGLEISAVATNSNGKATKAGQPHPGLIRSPIASSPTTDGRVSSIPHIQAVTRVAPSAPAHSRPRANAMVPTPARINISHSAGSVNTCQPVQCSPRAAIEDPAKPRPPITPMAVDQRAR